MGFGHRRKARILVFQALYQWVMTDQEPKLVMQQYLEANEEKKYDIDYFSELFPAITSGIVELDQLIQSVVIDRTIKEITPIELSVCRLAVYELKYVLDMPMKVVISQALQIEKRFGMEEGYRFVNGVLDAIAKQLRPQERQA